MNAEWNMMSAPGARSWINSAMAAPSSIPDRRSRIEDGDLGAAGHRFSGETNRSAPGCSRVPLSEPPMLRWKVSESTPDRDPASRRRQMSSAADAALMDRSAWLVTAPTLVFAP